MRGIHLRELLFLLTDDRDFMFLHTVLLLFGLLIGSRSVANEQLLAAVRQGDFDKVSILVKRASVLDSCDAQRLAHERWRALFIMMQQGNICYDLSTGRSISEIMFNCHKMCRDIFQMPEHTKPYADYQFSDSVGKTFSFQPVSRASSVDPRNLW